MRAVINTYNAGQRCSEHVLAHKGFSLIELLITIVILAIVATTAMPNMYEMVQRNRVAAESNNFLSTLSLARSEAVARSTNVSICSRPESKNPDEEKACRSSSQGGNCACDNSGHWENGWLVFTDANGDGEMSSKDGDILVAANGSLPVSIRRDVGRSEQKPLEQAHLTYTNLGTLRDRAATFSICGFGEDEDVLSQGRNIRLASSGSAHVSTFKSDQSIAEACQRR